MLYLNSPDEFTQQLIEVLIKLQTFAAQRGVIHLGEAEFCRFHVVTDHSPIPDEIRGIKVMHYSEEAIGEVFGCYYTLDNIKSGWQVTLDATKEEGCRILRRWR